MRISKGFPRCNGPADQCIAGYQQRRYRYDAVKAELDTARSTIAVLEKNKGDVAALQKTIDDYKVADAQREKDQPVCALAAWIYMGSSPSAPRDKRKTTSQWMWFFVVETTGLEPVTSCV